MAGQDDGDDFRGLRMAQGQTLIHRALRSFAPYRDRIARVHCIILREQEARFDICRRLAAELRDRPDSEGTAADLRATIQELHAVLRLHFAQEEENYFVLADDPTPTAR